MGSVQNIDHASFFTNGECPYFPCHAEVDPLRFNCLFCYCPLYALGPECPGSFSYLENGVKDCSRCLLPHDGDGFAAIVLKYWPQVSALAERPVGHRGSR